MPAVVDERPPEAVCLGSFRMVRADSDRVECNSCGAAVDADEPALYIARGEHRRLPQFPVGPLARASGSV